MTTANFKSFLLGRAALVVWGDVNSHEVNESALNDWWTNEHLPERLSIPGFNRARRYFSRDGSKATTKYLTLYEASDPDVLTSTAYMEKLNNPTLGTQQHIPTLATMQRSACDLVYSESRSELRVCGTGLGATMAMLVLSTKSDDRVDDRLQEYMSKSFSSLQSSNQNAMNLVILKENKAATEPGSSSQSYLNVKLKPRDEGDLMKWIVLFEFACSVRQPDIDVQKTLQPFIDDLGSVAKVETTNLDVYEFMCSVRSSK